MIRLVVGLGNPGKEYERTRHNAGFWLVERFASSKGIALRKDGKFKALVGQIQGTSPAGAAWLLLPQSFMDRPCTVAHARPARSFSQRRS